MKEVFSDEGKSFRLGSKIAAGGEGTVYELLDRSDQCVKVYHDTNLPNQGDLEKIRILISKSSELENFAALPIGIAHRNEFNRLLGGTLHPVGVFLKLIKGNDIFGVYNHKLRQDHFPNRRFDFLIRVALNLSRAFEELHKRDIVLGDVNEQNVKVRQDATISFIDCDSFQVKKDGRVFRCPVGAEMWTPPELIGVDLKTIDRTPNHDLFGLAQLIFLLFFAGRFPFAGVPPRGSELKLTEAVQNFAFAYAPKGMNGGLSPPPGAPPFDALPDYIQHSFLYAFTKGSDLPNSRPTASQWVQLLERFEGELKPCTANRGHVYWKEAGQCPWCKVYREQSWEAFPYFDRETARGLPKKYASLIQKLNRLSDVNQLIGNFEPASYKPVVSKIPEFKFPPKPTGIKASFTKSMSHRRWVELWLLTHYEDTQWHQRNIRNRVASSRQDCASQSRKFSSSSKDLIIRAREVCRQLSRPEDVARKVEKEFAKSARAEQLKDFLSSFRIRSTDIDGVGSERVATLASYGITTAADLERAKVMRIRGFGPAIYSNLDNWRKRIERSFVYDQKKPLSPRLRAERAKQVEKFQLALHERGLEILDQHRSLAEECQRHRLDFKIAVDEAYTTIAKLERDEAMLLKYLRKGKVLN